MPTGQNVARRVALAVLCAAYIQGGLAKILDFSGAIAEMEHFGLRPAVLLAAATVATELVGSALVISGYYRAVGAIWLALFTVSATLVANRYWELPLPERFMAENSFYEHLGLIGGLVYVALTSRRASA